MKRGAPLQRYTRLRSVTRLRPRSRNRSRRLQKRSSRYLAWIRTQPCLCGDMHVCCGMVEAHHQPEPGAASQARWNDFRAVPLCTLAHGQYHRERDAFSSYSIDFERVIARLNRLYEISTGRAVA